MNRVIETAPHPTDGDLVRYLDTELSELEEHRLRAHFAECDDCRRRVDALAAQSRSVSRYVAGSAIGGPDMVTRARALAAVRRANADRERSRWRHAFTRAASAAAIALAFAATVQPVRAWFLDGWSTLRGADVERPVAVALPPAAAIHRSSVVSFSPRDARFDLQIERFQAAGSVTVEIRDVDLASAQIVNGGEETILVLPTGLRVENQRVSRASYLVIVPSSLPLLRVMVGGKTLATLHTNERAAPWSRSFSLSGAAAGR